MTKPTQDFSKVSKGMQAALNGLKDYRDVIEEERALALFKHDLEWDAERRKLGFDRKNHKPFDYGFTRPRSVLREYRQKEHEFAERRRLIKQEFDDRLKDVQRLKDRLLDWSNGREEARDNAAPSVVKAFSRSTRQRGNDRGR
ncbi:hypothetical protein [Aquibaculum sediminis]|uniref:hypothetical protein n=1 Tax=Aquibaculum sediminis TaxID=3231907 RepID=UPI00345222A1